MKIIQTTFKDSELQEICGASNRREKLLKILSRPQWNSPLNEMLHNIALEDAMDYVERERGSA